ncbi:hypothetical protein ACFQX7_29245 [Luedemannella flava]
MRWSRSAGPQVPTVPVDGPDPIPASVADLHVSFPAAAAPSTPSAA